MKRFLICLFSLLLPVAIEAAAATATPYIVNKQGRGTNVALVTSTNEGVFTVTGPAGTGGAMSNNVSMTIAAPITYASAVATRTNPVNAVYYGAIGDGGVTDNLLSLQTALAVANSNHSDLFLPPGNYWISGSLCATNAKHVRIYGGGGKFNAVSFGGGTTISGGSNGYPMLDLSGSADITIQDVTFDSQATSKPRRPSCAILTGRTNDSMSSEFLTLERVEVYGDYTVAGLYTTASEIQRFVDCKFMPGDGTNGRAAVWIGRGTNNPYAAVTSLYQDISGVTGINGNSLSVFEHCTFQTLNDATNSIALGVDTFQNISLRDCYLKTLYATNSVVLRLGAYVNYSFEMDTVRFEYGTTNAPNIWITLSDTGMAPGVTVTNLRALRIINSSVVPIKTDDNIVLQDLFIANSHFNGRPLDLTVLDAYDLIDPTILMSDTNYIFDGAGTFEGVYRARHSCVNPFVRGVPQEKLVGFWSTTDGRDTYIGGNVRTPSVVSSNVTALIVRSAEADLVSTNSTGNGPFLTLENTSGANAGSFGPGLIWDNHVPAKHGFIMQQYQTVGSQLAIGNSASPFTDYLVLSQAGYLGIATNTPYYPLDVVGQARFSGGLFSGSSFAGDWQGASGYAAFGHATLAGTANAYGFAQSSAGSTAINAPTGQSVATRINGADVTTVTVNGLGVFTNNPQTALHVNGAVTVSENGVSTVIASNRITTGSILSSNANTGQWLSYDNASNLSFSNAITGTSNLNINAAVQFNFGSGGLQFSNSLVLFGTDNAVDVGQSSASRPRDVYAARDMYVGANRNFGSVSGGVGLYGPASVTFNSPKVYWAVGTFSAANTGIGLSDAITKLQIYSTTQNVFRISSPAGTNVFNIDTNGTTTVAGTITATNGVVNVVKPTTYADFTCAVSNQVYICNGTNQIVTLFNANANPGVIYRFTTTNGFGSFIITNATGAQTIRDGRSLSLTNIGISPVELVSDGNAWFLAGRAKLIFPNAQFSCSTNIPMTLANTAYPVTFDSTDWNNSQGIVRLAGTNGLHSRMWMTNSGVYEFGPSIVYNSGGPTHTARFWFMAGGANGTATNVPASCTPIKVASGDIVTTTVPFVFNVSQGPMFVEIWAQSDNTGDAFQSGSASGNFPATPSVICPVKKISDPYP